MDGPFPFLVHLVLGALEDRLGRLEADVAARASDKHAEGRGGLLLAKHNLD